MDSSKKSRIEAILEELSKYRKKPDDPKSKLSFWKVLFDMKGFLKLVTALVRELLEGF